MSFNRVDTIFGLRAEVDERSIARARKQLVESIAGLESGVAVKVRANVTGFSDTQSKKVNSMAAALERLKATGVTGVEINVAIKVTGSSEKTIAKLEAMIPTLTKLKALSPLIINVDVRGSAKATKALAEVRTASTATNASLNRLQQGAARTFSRFEFLGTAFIAQFAADIVLSAANDFAALEGQLRGVELSGIRAGVAVSGVMEVLRTASAETGNFALRQREAADAVGKLLIGGLGATEADIKRQKQIALGSGVVFGLDPSKLFERFSTAGLRRSIRVLDDLGIILRVKQAEEAYAQALGKTSKELTDAEKNQAFYKAALVATGTESLIAASKLETQFLTLQKAGVAVDNLRLAFGEVLLRGVVPLAAATGRLTEQQARQVAETTVNTARSALLTVGVTALSSAYAALGNKLKVFKEAEPSARAFTLTNVGLFAVMAVVTAAMDDYAKRVKAAADRTLDLQQNVLALQQTFGSIGLGTPAQIELNELERKIGSAGIDPGVAGAISGGIGPVSAFVTSLEEQVAAFKTAGSAADGFKTQADGVRQALSDYVDQAITAAKTNKDLGEGYEAISDISRTVLQPELQSLFDMYVTLSEQEAINEVKSRSTWQKIGDGIAVVVHFIGDTFAEFYDDMANNIGSLGDSITSAMDVVLGVATRISGSIIKVFNSLASGINVIIQGINQLPGVSFQLGPTAYNIGGPKLREISLIPQSAANIAGDALGIAGGSLINRGKNRLNSLPVGLNGGLQGDPFVEGLFLLGAGRGDEFGTGATENLFRNITGTNELNARAGVLNNLQKYLETVASIGFNPPPVGDPKKKGGGKKPKAPFVNFINGFIPDVFFSDGTGTTINIINGDTGERSIGTFQGGKEGLEALERAFQSRRFFDELEGRTTIEDLRRFREEQLKLLEQEIETQKKAIEQAVDSLKFAEDEANLRRGLGEKIDETKLQQEALKSWIDLQVKYGRDAADEYLRQTDALSLVNDALEEQARNARREILNKNFNSTLGLFSFQSRLAQAREPDANRDAVLGYNATLNELTLTLQNANRQLSEGLVEPGSDDALNIASRIRELVISMEEQNTSIREGGFVVNKEDKDKLSRAVANLTPEAVALADKLAPEALGLNQVTSSMTTLQRYTDTFATGLQTAGSLLVGAITSAAGVFGRIPGVRVGGNGGPSTSVAPFGSGFSPSVNVNPFVRRQRLDYYSVCSGSG